MAKRRKCSVPFSVESLREEALTEISNETTGTKILTDLSSIDLNRVDQMQCFAHLL